MKEVEVNAKQFWSIAHHFDVRVDAEDHAFPSGPRRYHIDMTADEKKIRIIFSGFLNNDPPAVMSLEDTLTLVQCLARST